MRTLFSRLTLAATFGLALAFTFSCSSNDNGGGGGDGGNKNNNNQNGSGDNFVNCKFDDYCHDKSKNDPYTYDECLLDGGTAVESCPSTPTPPNPTCGSVQYNPETEQCCGNNKYTHSKQFCSGNTVYDKCGITGLEEYGEIYNPSTQFCSGSSLNRRVYDKCGGSVVYNPETEECCGSNKFTTTSTRFCSGNTVYDKCGGSVVYNPSTEQCCGSSKFTTSTQFCSGTTVVAKCGGSVQYNPETEQCCGSNKFTTDKQYCSNGTVKNYGSLIDSRGTFSREYKTVVIGEQTWMAQNLTYDTAGRAGFYTWDVAMAGAASSSANPSGRKGICPTGWHLPSDAEWDILVASVGGSSVAGTKLKAKEGWDGGNGTDIYGFSAKATGYYSSIYGTRDSGIQGYWWSSRAYGTDLAYYYTMKNSSNAVTWESTGKSMLYSVRCVKN